MDKHILLKIDEQTKERIRELAMEKRRSMNSLILSFIDEKISEVENGMPNAQSS
jgi:hypothetical protein